MRDKLDAKRRNLKHELSKPEVQNGLTPRFLGVIACRDCGDLLFWKPTGAASYKKFCESCIITRKKETQRKSDSRPERIESLRQWHFKRAQTEKRKKYASDYNKNEERKILVKKWHISTRYGLSGEAYDKALAAQNFLCSICKEVPNDGKFHVDHCHTTGIVRGLLCRQCNLGIGNFKDRIDLLQSTINYLKSGLDITLTSSRQARRVQP